VLRPRPKTSATCVYHLPSRLGAARRGYRRQDPKCVANVHYCQQEPTCPDVMTTAIAVRALTKIYRVHERPPGLWAALRAVFRRQTKAVVAVSDLSFTIESGERVGFLGPNGAGKTTTLKTLSGLLYPTSGEVSVLDYVPQKRDPDFLRAITLVMGQKQQLLWDLPPAETFDQNRAIYGIPQSTYDEAWGELDKMLEIGALAKKPTRQLSLGERMKCELAAALLHRPRVLFLDEPTIGLDVSMQLVVRDFIRSYNEKRGATVLLTSHDMGDVASLCPRVIIIDEGKLKYDGSLEKLVKTVRQDKRIVLTFDESPDRELLEKMGKVVEFAPGRAVLAIAQGHVREAMGQLLATPGIHDLTVEDPPLEEVMRDLFAHDKERVEPAS
jgi:ABC-2 type transport system ATP-binding protein